MATPTLDQVPDEIIAKLVIRSVYEGDDTRPGGTEVLSVDNVQIGIPPGGWSCTALIDSPDGELTLDVVFDGERYSDTVQGAGVKEDAADPKPWPL